MEIVRKEEYHEYEQGEYHNRKEEDRNQKTAQGAEPLRRLSVLPGDGRPGTAEGNDRAYAERTAETDAGAYPCGHIPAFHGSGVQRPRHPPGYLHL